MESFIFPDINIKGEKNTKSFNKIPSILYKQLPYEDLQQQNSKSKVRAKRKGNWEERNRKQETRKWAAKLGWVSKEEG